MLYKIQLGEWVKGPFANTTIEGFIVNETKGTYSVKVKNIAKPMSGKLPNHLHEGSVHILPKRVIQDFYVTLNNQQQHNLISLAMKIGEFDWATSLLENFYNPESILQEDHEEYAGLSIYSNLLRKNVYITANDRKRLYSFYLKTVEKGMAGKIKGPGEINSSESLDAVISSVVLIAKCKEGTNYITELVNGPSEFDPILD